MADETSPKPNLNVERFGVRQYTATNSRGAKLVIGNNEGEFSPGELLQLAILGCNVLSADARFSRALGEDFALTGTVSGEYNKEEDRYTQFLVELFPNLAMMDVDDRAQLMKRAAGAIDRYCTIGHTVTQSAPTTLKIDGEPL